MALTADEITICNEALGHLGEYEVSSSKTSEKQYVICERYYDAAVQEVLCEHPWNEAKKRAYVVESADAPVFGFSHQFALPTDCLRLLRIGDGDGDWDFWEVEGGYILTNRSQSGLTYSSGTDYVAGQYISEDDVTYLVDTSFTATGTFATDAAAYLTSQTDDLAVLKIEYIYSLTTISSWSPKLRHAIAQKLAIKVATHLTNDPATKNSLLNEYESLTLRKARSVDAMQGRIRPLFKSKWWNTRQTNWS